MCVIHFRFDEPSTDDTSFPLHYIKYSYSIFYLTKERHKLIVAMLM